MRGSRRVCVCTWSTSIATVMRDPIRGVSCVPRGSSTSPSTIASMATRTLPLTAPGKNRILYLWGHLTAVNDAMFSVLRLGERRHPELDAVFIAQPDRSVPLPTSTEIAKCWEDVHTELLSRFKTLSSKEWLERHGNVSPEEFERNPTRNRLAVLLGRTNHASYHFGQMILAKPKTP